MGGTTPSCAPQGRQCGDQIVNLSELVETNVKYPAAQERLVAWEENPLGKRTLFHVFVCSIELLLFTTKHCAPRHIYLFSLNLKEKSIVWLEVVNNLHLNM